MPAYRESQNGTLSQRIRRCAELAGSGDALAQKTAIPRRTLETYLSGRAEPKATRLLAIADAVGVTLDWLLAGKEPMRRDGDHADPAEAPVRRPGESKTWTAVRAAGLDHLDEQTIVAAVVAVEEYLAEEGFELDAERKGQLVGLLYDIAIDQAVADRPVDQRQNVTRLFNIVS